MKTVDEIMELVYEICAINRDTSSRIKKINTKLSSEVHASLLSYRTALNEYQAENDKYKALKAAVRELIVNWETKGVGFVLKDIFKLKSLIKGSK